MSFGNRLVDVVGPLLLVIDGVEFPNPPEDVHSVELFTKFCIQVLKPWLHVPKLYVVFHATLTFIYTLCQSSPCDACIATRRISSQCERPGVGLCGERGRCMPYTCRVLLQTQKLHPTGWVHHCVCVRRGGQHKHSVLVLSKWNHVVVRTFLLYYCRTCTKPG